ncbi:hypothetical protein ANN_21521, partial [Periplaneta americana]
MAGLCDGGNEPPGSLKAKFSIWKANEEKEKRAHFVTHTGAKRLVDGTIRWYYVCYRSATFQSKGKGSRQLKSQGSCKIGHSCLATMEVTENLNAEIHVTYFSAHYGHSFDVAHSLLSAEEKSSIAGKLAEGVPLQTVLDHIRNAATGDLARIHIVTKLDLHNIMANFNINHSERLHQNDK